MKIFRILSAIFILLSVISIYGAEPEIVCTLDPESVAPGESFNLTISSDSTIVPELQQMIDEIKVEGRSVSTRTINGRTTSSVTYRCVTQAKEGTLNIPPLQVKLGSKTLKTPKLKLEITKSLPVKSDDAAGVSMELKDMIFGEGVVFPARKDFYVGEEISLSFKLFFMNNLQMQSVQYPQVDAGKSIFSNFNNQENRQFAPPSQSRVKIDGKVFNRINFTTKFRPLAPGKLILRAEQKCVLAVKEPNQKRSNDSWFDDDFFFSRSNYRQIPYDFYYKLPELTVKVLPELPSGEIFTGLIGDYQVDFELKEREVPAGEAVNLAIKITGDNGFENLMAPKLEINDFRVYPPEIKKSANQAILNYVLIPLKSGEYGFPLNFAIFESEKHQYKNFVFDGKITVKPPLRNFSSEPEPALSNPANPAADAKGAVPAANLLYLKKAPQLAGTLPPWSGWIMALLFAPIVYLIASLIFRIHERRGKSVAYLRRKNALVLRRNLIAELKKSPDGRIAELLSGEFMDFLLDYYNLDRQSSSDEIIEKIPDKNAAALLEKFSGQSYLPPELRQVDASARRTLLDLLRKLSVFFLIFGACFFTALQGTEIKDYSGALNAFDRKDYAGAQKFFLEQVKNYPQDSSALYNLGCIAAAENKYPLANYYFESAHLLNPRDSAITENLNFIRRKLFQEEYGHPKDPVALVKYLMSLMRPHEYFWVIATLYSLLWGLWFFRKKISAAKMITVFSAVLLLLVIALIAMLELQSYEYSGKYGMIVSDKAELYPLPLEQKNDSAPPREINGGGKVKITDERNGFYYIQDNGNSGWLKKSAVKRQLEK